MEDSIWTVLIVVCMLFLAGLGRPRRINAWALGWFLLEAFKEYKQGRPKKLKPEKRLVERTDKVVTVDDDGNVVEVGQEPQHKEEEDSGVQVHMDVGKIARRAWDEYSRRRK